MGQRSCPADRRPPEIKRAGLVKRPAPRTPKRSWDLVNAGAPELGADGEAPLRRVEARAEVAHLEDADGRVVALQRHGEARVLPGFALAVRPRDETLEPFDGRRRRRDEARHFLRRQKGE